MYSNLNAWIVEGFKLKCVIFKALFQIRKVLTYAFSTAEKIKTKKINKRGKEFL